jgi:glycosyltransferase involved in cell wall biosynthesis
MEAANVTICETGISNRLLWARTRLTGRPYLDQLVGGADVFFFPHFLVGATSPDCRRVLTMHDLSFERFPELFSRRGMWWHTFQMRPQVQARLADRIIAVSESTRQDLIDLYGIDPERVATVYSGVNPNLRRPSKQEIADFCMRNHLPERFILMLGAREPRKNSAAVFAAAKQLNVPVIAHDISSDERALWLSAASVLAYPSLMEGFGFPPLEALVCGTPSVIGANSSMLQVMGDAALAVNPYSVSELTGALQAILDDQRLRQQLILRGSGAAERFSWNTAARQTLGIIVQ